MSAESDHLAALLRDAPDPGGWRAGMDSDDYREMAEWLAARGVRALATTPESDYVAPLREWTAEELDALPKWSAVVTYGSVWIKHESGEWIKSQGGKIRDSVWLAHVARRIAYDPRWDGIA